MPGNRHIIGKWATAMSTAKQAMENMEYVRRLLEEKQPGFAASVELALALFHRQIEWPEETMELTLPSVARTPHPPLIEADD
jgi:hypothetical protein